MIKSELIDALAKKRPHLERKEVELAVACMLEQMSKALTANDRIEIRGFGSFSLRHHPPYTGRDPRSGAELNLPARYSPYFKPGKALRQRVDLLRETCQIKRKA
ncbi:MAG: integration host factor subunit beta [Methylobacter sp.]|nr:integration host factor subunit beta [Methylobacter sp.]